MHHSYSATTDRQHGVDTVTLRQSDDVYARVTPSLGNNCFEFQCGDPVFDPVPLEEYLKKPTAFGLPVLMPFPNRIDKGVFRFESKRYEVDPNRHGYVRNRPWRLADQGAGGHSGAYVTSTFRAADHRDILAQFPFPFSIEVTYRLKNGILSMETRIGNEGDGAMPYGFGIHPYFRRPAGAALEIPAKQRFELVDALPTGKLIDVEGPYDFRQRKAVGDLALDDIYTGLMPDENGDVRCCLCGSESDASVIIQFGAEQFPHVVVFTPPEPRQAICIEPYTCPTDGFNLRDRGICHDDMVLGPGSAIDLSLSLSIQPRRDDSTAP